MLFKIKKIFFIGYNTFLVLALLFFYINNKDMESAVIVAFVISINFVLVLRFYKDINASADFTFYAIYLVLFSFCTLLVYHLIIF